ncbi:hypothetical protein [Fictibacillus barbaricus]|uniref:Uncharacterized protein n=1 Tax=Fictibacillus barbaricus TaxID=182136 RepID=A0ABU1TYT5_9BACL|nr:hypothetical protein [Fictibacillus barbaricus]MDR7072368.1 hypothetical protein [Fictibacillus barbaricus]
MIKLSMPAGLLMEAAIAGGVDGNKLIEVLRNNDLQALKHIDKEETSWMYLFQYAEDHWESMIEAIHEGYTYKFITIRGLLNLIQTKFSLEENQDFSMDEASIQLALNDEQLRFLQSRIPEQWIFIKNEADERFNFRAILAQNQQIKS